MRLLSVVALICVGLSVILFLVALLFTKARWYERYWWIYLLAVFTLFAVGVGWFFMQGALHPLNSRFYIFPDPSGRRVLMINGKSLAAYSESSDPTYIKLRGRQVSNRVQIAEGDSVEYDVNLPPGIYSVNLSTQHWITSEEIHYGQWSLPSWRLHGPERRGVGIHSIADAEHLDAVVYDFDTAPPEKITVRSSSRGNIISAFDLKASTW